MVHAHRWVDRAQAAQAASTMLRTMRNKLQPSLRTAPGNATATDRDGLDGYRHRSQRRRDGHGDGKDLGKHDPKRAYRAGVQDAKAYVVSLILAAVSVVSIFEKTRDRRGTCCAAVNEIHQV